MKHNTMSSKKLIKNFVYLVVSALVLVSATIAWFASGDTADVESISIPLATSQFNIQYYRADVSEEFVYDTQAGAMVPINLEEKQTLQWQSADNIDITALYPGVYNAFKIVVIANETGNPSLSFNGLNCLYPENKEDVYKSIFIRAVAYNANGERVAEASGSFSNFISEGSDSMTVFSLGSVAKNATLTVYIDIGIPGFDVNETHDGLRSTGSEIRIGSVAIS